MDSKNKVLVNFSVGRGGRFNNGGHLTFCGVGSKCKGFVEEENFIRYENEWDIVKENEDLTDKITDLGCETNTEEYKAFCEKYGNLGRVVLTGGNGDEIGDYEGGECEYNYNIDNDYDTTYGKYIGDFSDLSESEQEAVFKSPINYELKWDLGIDFNKRFEIRAADGTVLHADSGEQYVKSEFDDLENDEDQEIKPDSIWDVILNEQLY